MDNGEFSEFIKFVESDSYRYETIYPMKLFIHGYGYIYLYMVYCSPLLNIAVDKEASYTRNCLKPIFKAYQKWLCYIFKFIPNSYA